ncbi:MAG: DUF3817 domain-containing protein [Acidimicrobiales bacterium]|mgnify:FL=1|nr:DUF3817 domain-containing protein [Acidimicrobiales bacterium]
MTTATPTQVDPGARALMARASLIEAVSYLALLGGVFAKRVLDAPGEGGVPILGPIHGLVYLAYAGAIMATRDQLGWKAKETILALVVGAIPFGGFWVHSRLVPPA